MRRSIDAHCHCEAQRAVAIASFDSMLHLNHRRFPRRFAPRNDRQGRLLDKNVGAAISRPCSEAFRIRIRFRQIRRILPPGDQWSPLHARLHIARQIPVLSLKTTPPLESGGAQNYDPYSFTGTLSRISIVSMSTAQSMAITVTPFSAASRRAAPKAGSRSSWGRRYFTSAIWMTKST